MSFMAGYMLGLADSREPALTDISVTENGEYLPPEEYDGFGRVSVNVSSQAAVNALFVSEPGIYNAAEYGCDGFDPVNVGSKYRDLYDMATGSGGTNSTEGGAEISNSVASGSTDNTNDYLLSFKGTEPPDVTNHGNSVRISFGVEMTPHPVQADYFTLDYQWKAENLLTGESRTGSCFSVHYGWNKATTRQPLFRLTKIEYGSGIVKIYYTLTRYWESGSVRDNTGGRCDFDRNSVGAEKFTDSWIISQ